MMRMKNVKDHEKILGKITALERDSVNYFDVEREFFLIDSDNLSDVQPRFYGYSIQADGIYEQENLTPEAINGLNGRGCYVYVEVQDGQITIKQDLNGSWGLYLFRHDDYFALSNSFFRLLDHVKFRYPLTLNRDYCHYLLLNGLCSDSYSETAVNEIQLVNRNAIIHIDTAGKTFETELIDYKEHSVSLDSEEGIATLDRWVEFWSKVFRGIAQRTKFFQADLSGDFDGRVSFAILLNSGINLNNLRIFSVKGDLPAQKKEFDLSSQIAAHYGFELNQPLPDRQSLNLSLNDAFNCDLYVNRTFSNIPRIRVQKGVQRLYRLGRAAGEGIRKFWQMPPKEFVKTFTRNVNLYSQNLTDKLTTSIENVLNSSLRAVSDKYQITDANSKDIPQLLYYETRSRYHFGKDLLCNYFINTVLLTPAIDPEVRTLKLYTPECSDANLLIALLFTRFQPDLLNFPFNSNRSIASETLDYAQKLNERFPRNTTTDDFDATNFNLLPNDARVEEILASGSNNPNIPGNLPENCLKVIFESSKNYGLFLSSFDEELYRYATIYYTSHTSGRNRPMYAVCGVTKVLEDLEISQRNYPKYQDMKRFIEQDFGLIRAYESDAAQIVKTFSPYFTARIQFQLWQKVALGTLNLISVSDDDAKVSSPEWFNKNGVGYVIQSYTGKLKIVARAFVSGQIRLSLLGLDIRNPEDKTERIPYWIDYTKLTVNGKTIFNKLTPAWHDQPYRHNFNVKVVEDIVIEVEWLPHRSDT